MRRPGAPPATALPLHLSPAFGPARPLLPTGAAKRVLGRVVALLGGRRPHAHLAVSSAAPSSPAGQQLPGPGLQSTEEAHREVETRPSHPAAGDEQKSEGASPPTAPWPPSTQANRGPCSPHLSSSVTGQPDSLCLNLYLPRGPRPPLPC